MSQMQVLLKIEERGGGPPRLVKMESVQLRIGRRAEGNQIVLKKRSVSRRHAVLARQEGRFVLADCKSAGGTFVNGERVTAPRVVRPGDRIAIGEYLLTVVLDPGGASEFEQESTGEMPIKPTSGDLHPRDDVAFGDAGDAVTLHHADGGADRAHFEQAVLTAAFANLPKRPAVNTTDRGAAKSAVVWASAEPRVFPGGDLGALCVCMAAGKLAEQGAEVARLELDLQLADGFSMQELHRHLRSVRTNLWDERAAIAVRAVTVTTPGQAPLPPLILRASVEGERVLGSVRAPAAGDAVVVSGPVGSHGISLAALRGQARLEQDVFSDAEVTSSLVRALAEAKVPCVALGFPFEGGLAHCLADLARRHQVRVLLDEAAAVVEPAVEAAALTLDLDPRFEPSAGRLVAVVPRSGLEACLAAWRKAGASPIAAGVVLGVEAGRGSVVVGTAKRHKPLRREMTSPDDVDLA